MTEYDGRLSIVQYLLYKIKNANLQMKQNGFPFLTPSSLQISSLLCPSFYTLLLHLPLPLPSVQHLLLKQHTGMAYMFKGLLKKSVMQALKFPNLLSYFQLQ